MAPSEIAKATLRWLGMSILLVPPCHASSIGTVVSDVCNIRLEGEITDGDAGRIKAAIEKVGASRIDDHVENPQICLNSTGGGLSETLRIIDLFKTEISIGTVVDSGDRCLSTCALVFMAGQTDINHGFKVPWRRLSVGGTIEFQMPLEKVDSGPQRAAAVQAAYATGVNLVADLIARSTAPEGYEPADRSQMFPRSLLLDLLARDPKIPLRIETIEQAGQWNIQLFGFKVPDNLTDGMLLQACLNVGHWEGDLNGPRQNIKTGTPQLVSPTLLSVKFTGLDLGKTAECKASRYDKPNGSIVAITFGQEAFDASDKQDYYGPKNTDSVLGTQIWAVFDPETPLTTLRPH